MQYPTALCFFRPPLRQLIAILFLALCGSAVAAEPAGNRSPWPSSDLNLRLDAPIVSWDEAIPLGNGLTGGLLWGEKNVVRLSLDRGDLCDERTSGPKEWWKDQTWKKGGSAWESAYNGTTPTKLPAGRLEITLPANVKVQQFELDLVSAQGVARLSNGKSVDAFFSAVDHFALPRIPGPTQQAFDLMP